MSRAKPWSRPLHKALRLSPLLLIVAAIAVSNVPGLVHPLSWKMIAERQDELRAMVAARPLASGACFIAAYAAIVAASLPIAALATFAGGLLFGPLLGAMLAVSGATLGASLVFLTVRSALAPLLTRHVAGALARIGPHLQRDGFSYLLALRLLPVVPFWLVNIVAGLSGLSLPVFALGTLLGIIPASIIYSGIGAGLSAILVHGEEPDLRMILSPPLLLPLVGLALLSLLPILWRRRHA